MKYRFSFQYPDNWETVVDTFNGTTKIAPYGGFIGSVSIGPKGIKGEGYDGYFGFYVYDKNKTTLENEIAQYGNQFPDRKESSEQMNINGKQAIKITVTSPKTAMSYGQWTAIHYMIETSDYIYTLGNGASNEYATLFEQIARTIKIN